VVEGELKDSFWRKKMERRARNYKDHYIVCGIGVVGTNIVDELWATKRPYVIVDMSRDSFEKLANSSPAEIFIQGDATDDSTLLRAGIKKAKGVFAVTGDDNQNFVICLTAKQLNPDLKVVAECNEIRNNEKMKKAGADSVVSPSFIGGLRMASEMIRPTVVSFLDTMLRDKKKNLRIEEIPVPGSLVGKPISGLELKRYSFLLPLAVKTEDDFVYNPADDHIIQRGNTLIFMTTPGEREQLEKILNSPH